MVYLIHFDEKLAHAQHYLGFSIRTDIGKRIKEHQGKGRSKGAKIMAAVNAAKIGWSVVRIWENADRNFERLLKKRKNTSKFCPICHPESALNKCIYIPPPVDDSGASF